MICLQNEFAIVVKSECIVILGAPEIRAFEAVSELDALNCGDRIKDLRKLCFDTVEDRTSDTFRITVDNALDDAAYSSIDYDAYVEPGVEYDEEDAVCLDNMGQFLYRVKGDKAAAKPWFEKALAQKEGQIDTLWFLSRYDVEAGDTKAAAAKLEKLLEGRFSPLNYVTRETAEKELERLKGAN